MTLDMTKTNLVAVFQQLLPHDLADSHLNHVKHLGKREFALLFRGMIYCRGFRGVMQDVEARSE
jgi:hypothetical protein